MNYVWQTVLSRLLTWELVITFLENIYVICYTGYIREWFFFCHCKLFSRLPVMHITFWSNDYSVIKMFSMPSTSVERFSWTVQEVFSTPSFILIPGTWTMPTWTVTGGHTQQRNKTEGTRTRTPWSHRPFTKIARKMSRLLSGLSYY